MSLTRRGFSTLLPAGLLLPSAGRAAPLPVAPLAFTVWRKGSKIGTHTVEFGGDQNQLTVRSRANFSIGLGPISFFRYVYDVTERWNGGVLHAIAATTNNNGRHDTCEAQREGDALLVDGSKSGRYVAPPPSIAGTHWCKAELNAPIINPENGVLMNFTVASRGRDTPPGGSAPAEHYALTGFATLDLWYDESGVWCGLRAVAKDTSIVEYKAA